MKKTSDFRPSSRDQMENWLYFQLLIFGGKEGEQVSGHWGLFPYCFSEIHINFWLKFQSSLLWPFQGRTTQSLQQRQWFHFCACLIPQKLLLSSFEKQKFKVCFSVFVLKLHCFILSSKPGTLLKGIFWLKRNLFLFFFVCFARLCSLKHLTHPLGCFGSLVQPPALTAPGAQKAAGRAMLAEGPVLTLTLWWDAGDWQWH